MKQLFLPPVKKRKPVDKEPESSEMSCNLEQEKAPKVSMKQSFLPPVKKRKPIDKESESHKSEKRKKTNNAMLNIIAENMEVKSLTEANLPEVTEMLTGCKELSFLLVFKEGFTQFRDM